jgi:hypothetical protein
MAASQKKTARKISDDAVWNDIFDSLVIENEPPIEYIKQVTIRTKDGSLHRVSAKHFAEIIEQERHLTPDESEIRSCKMSINFQKLRNDVDTWTEDLIRRLDGPAQSTAKRKRKPAAKGKVATRKRSKS